MAKRATSCFMALLCATFGPMVLLRLLHSRYLCLNAAQVRSWLNDSDTPAAIRATPGVQDVQFSFCPGEGWLAARYIFDDLDGLRAFPDSAAFAQAKDEVTTHPHYDSSRQPHEFKGFFLPEV